MEVAPLLRLIGLQQSIQRISFASIANDSYISLIKMMLTLLFMWHHLACLYWLLGSYVVNDTGYDDWTPQKHVNPDDVGAAYVRSLLWTVSVTTKGRLQLPQNTNESLFETISMMVGVTVYAFCLGNVSSAVANLNLTARENRRRMEQVAHYMNQRDVPQQLQRRIVQYYEFLYSCAQGSQMLSAMNDLHPNLKTEMTISMNQRLLSKVRLFEGVSQACMAALVSRIQGRIYLPAEFIVTEGEMGKEIFFILRGEVQVEAKGIVLTVLSAGDFFGEKVKTPVHSSALFNQ